MSIVPILADVASRGVPRPLVSLVDQYRDAVKSVLSVDGCRIVFTDAFLEPRSPVASHTDDMLWVVRAKAGSGASSSGQDVGSASGVTIRDNRGGPSSTSSSSTSNHNVALPVIGIIRRGSNDATDLFEEAARDAELSAGGGGGGAGGSSEASDVAPSGSSSFLANSLRGVVRAVEGVSKAPLGRVLWPETLALNIATQWRYTLTVAVVKMCLLQPAQLRRASRGDGNVPPTPPQPPHHPQGASTDASSTGRYGMVAVRHEVRQVYGQPIKPAFRSKDGRAEDNNSFDYPNIYFNVEDFDNGFSDMQLCGGYSIAVLLTAGESTDSNVTLFRGVLSYEAIMARVVKKHQEHKRIADEEQREFISLLGPERRGRAEIAVCLSASEIMMMQLQSQLQKSQPLSQNSSSNGGAAAANGSPTSPKPQGGGRSPSHRSPDGSSQQRSPVAEQPNSGGGFFQNLFNKKNEGGGASTKPSGSSSSSNNNNNNTEPSSSGPLGFLSNIFKKNDNDKKDSATITTLRGDEALQCSMTYVSIPVTHILSILQSREPAMAAQWLYIPESRDELDYLLEHSQEAMIHKEMEEKREGRR